MQLYLMQHGQSEAEQPDPPLNRTGVVAVRAAAGALKRLGISLDTIVCSPKKRSRQSAALVAEIVNYPYTDILESAAFTPAAPAAAAVEVLAGLPEQETVLVAGHLPSLAEIATVLLGASVRIRFENGCLCRIDTSEFRPGAGELVFHLSSAQLRLIASGV